LYKTNIYIFAVYTQIFNNLRCIVYLVTKTKQSSQAKTYENAITYTYAKTYRYICVLTKDRTVYRM